MGRSGRLNYHHKGRSTLQELARSSARQPFLTFERSRILFMCLSTISEPVRILPRDRLSFSRSSHAMRGLAHVGAHAPKRAKPARLLLWLNTTGILHKYRAPRCRFRSRVTAIIKHGGPRRKEPAPVTGGDTQIRARCFLRDDPVCDRANQMDREAWSQ
jgi:hypothetical protein